VTTTSRWIELQGAVNVRDVGGLPTEDGRVVARDRLIRSDNLQNLTESDVRQLVDEHRVRAVADLRTGVEVANEGPGPLTRETAVDIRHYSLFPEAGQNTDAAAVEGDGPVVLPWQKIPSAGQDDAPRTAAEFYLRYLLDRPDSILDTLRLIAATDGATIVHCAAGKDRTGVVVAVALSEVGVRRADIIEDYALSAERIHEIFARLRASNTYADDLADATVDKHAPRDSTMEELLAAIDKVHGGVPAWLRKHGWTDADAARLRERLLED
jgi:protein tyrosine/serine phosphatase